ncbi:hypothetical protein [Caulobacter segnis]|uniref:hypothetical protein n=1 Tax=Caulobacter segnis TaxID=88688 RepID=UPI001CBC4C12|nr:hypothetical protein [Caulobacter segnis]UAL09389.1 hypothetical protein K8940_16580 [Caulobacter segnis]
MSIVKVQKGARSGVGALTIGREERAVTFSLVITNGVAGRKGGKGSLTGDPDILRQAFRAGDCRLTLDDGAALGIAVIAHTEGGDVAYFELR